MSIGIFMEYANELIQLPVNPEELEVVKEVFLKILNWQL